MYGPPGTGKTFVTEHLARHLVAGVTGFVEVLQFHSAYAYEDFIHGIRPRVTPNWPADLRTSAGSFVDFLQPSAWVQRPVCPDRG